MLTANEVTKNRQAMTSRSTNAFRCAPAAETLSWLRSHPRTRDPPADRRISPCMGYTAEGLASGESDSWVGDLILECEVTVDQSQGEFVLELSKGPDRFQAQWDLADGFCTLYRVTEANAEAKREGKGPEIVRDKLKSEKTTLTGGTHRLRFANVDQRL